MFIIKKIYNNNENKNINLYLFLFCLVILFYSSIYILSFIKVVNFWSFSQSFISYTEGFIKRGMFGTIMLFFENAFNIRPRTFFASFYIFFYSLNIFLFFKLIKKYLENKLLLIFLALCPTLIMFPFNDLGGYQRLDVLSITGILLHSLIAQRFFNFQINSNQYNKILNLLILPFLVISILFHEIQLISLPFHFFVTLNINNINFKQTIRKYLLFFIPLFLILFIYPDDVSLKKLEELVNNRGIWMDAYLFHTKNIGFDHYMYELKTNLLIIYNFKIHLAMVILAVFPFYIILYYLDKNEYLKSINPINYFFFTLSVTPFLLGLLIGDFGRWVNIMSFVAFGYLVQFPLKKSLKSFEFLSREFSKLFLNIILISIVTFYIFFIRIPHCCNLQKNEINLYGGIVSKTIAITNVVLRNTDNKDFNLDSRFKN